MTNTQSESEGKSQRPDQEIDATAGIGELPGQSIEQCLDQALQELGYLEEFAFSYGLYIAEEGYVPALVPWLVPEIYD